MQVSVVLTIIGPDRPGLVRTLSNTIAESGGNWLESRMAHLGGQFAGILHVQVNADEADELIDALGRLESEGLSVNAQRSGQIDTTEEGNTVRLEFVGHDRTGLVREMTAALARRKINVEKLETQVVSAPMSGEPMFTANALLRIPGDVAEDEVREEIEHIADQLGLDVSLEAE